MKRKQLQVGGLKHMDKRNYKMRMSCRIKTWCKRANKNKLKTFKTMPIMKD